MKDKWLRLACLREGSLTLKLCDILELGHGNAFGGVLLCLCDEGWVKLTDRLIIEQALCNKLSCSCSINLWSRIKLDWMTTLSCKKWGGGFEPSLTSPRGISGAGFLVNIVFTIKVTITDLFSWYTTSTRPCDTLKLTYRTVRLCQTHICIHKKCHTIISV